MSNIQPYIIINGVNSRTISGLLITSLPPISKPQVRTQVETIDGRSGDIVTPLGYAAYDKPIKIGLTRNYDIDEVIEFFNTSGTVIFSNEPTKYYRFAIYEQIDFEKLINFKTAEVVLHVQPYKFSTTEKPLLFNDPTEISVENKGNTDARPNLLITGSGEIDVSLNGSQLLSMDLGENDQTVIIDSEDMNAYGAQSAIREVVADIEPKQAGSGDPSPDNIREISGFTEANIVNTQIEEIRELFTIDPSFRGRVNFNQLINNGNFESSNGWHIGGGDTLTIENNTAYYKAGQRYHNISFYKNNMISKGHKYILISTVLSYTDTNTVMIFRVIKDYATLQQPYYDLKAQKTLAGIILSANYDGDAQVIFQDNNTSNYGDIIIKNVNVFDLTQLFGEEIADYIYNLEQSQAGAGVEFFKAIYPQEYYPYNVGQDKIVGDITPVTVNLGQTVYGGRLNVTTGELLITTATKGVNDFGALVSAKSPGGLHWIEAQADCLLNTNAYCNMLELKINNIAWRSSTECFSAENGTVRVYTTSETKEDFNNRFSNLFIVFTLVEPITVQLTPTQINNLLGLNNLYSDTGDLSVKYKSGGVIQTQTGDIVTFTVGVGDMDKGTLLNRLITGNYDKIRLKKGENVISFTGNVKRVSIDKYSRWI